MIYQFIFEKITLIRLFKTRQKWNTSTIMFEEIFQTRQEIKRQTVRMLFSLVLQKHLPEVFLISTLAKIMKTVKSLLIRMYTGININLFLKSNQFGKNKKKFVWLIFDVDDNFAKIEQR